MTVAILSPLHVAGPKALPECPGPLQMVGHASQASKPGEYFTGTIADINYVVVRGNDNKLRAFHNVRRMSRP